MPQCAVNGTFRERFGLQARACDVWALGVTVFWCVFGILPYEGETLQVFHRMRTVEWSGRSCRLRCRAVQDTVLGALERRLGCSAARDTVSCGIPCRVGHFAMRDTVPCGIHLMPCAMKGLP